MHADIMARTLELFEKPARAKPRVLMHVIDAGDNERGDKQLARLRCGKCGSETEWLEFDSVTAAKRGLPCEACNS